VRPGGRAYAARRRGASWIPALIIILLLVGAGVLAWMFLTNNEDGSTEFSPVPSVVSLVT
jgi:flagellar basal body-associated protein FliL